MRFYLPSDLLSGHKGVFITGTDTGVGKTFIACLIARELRKKGISIGVMKPISTGSRHDALLLRKSAGVDDPLDEINPVYFKKSLAPCVAARFENRNINLTKILKSYKNLCLRHKFLIVEGIGGLLVPITDKAFTADLAKMFGLPLVIVSRPGLGAINHTLLTINCARQRGLKILGFVLDYAKPMKKGLAEKTNPKIISELGKIKFLGDFPYTRKCRL